MYRRWEPVRDLGRICDLYAFLRRRRLGYLTQSEFSRRQRTPSGRSIGTAIALAADEVPTLTAAHFTRVTGDSKRKQ